MSATETMPADLTTRVNDFATELVRQVTPATVVRRDEPLAKRTTLRVGGPADVYVEPASETELSTVLKLCQQFEVPFFILGRGSNLLIKDKGIRGAVICLAQPAFAKFEIIGEQLHCGAGVRLKTVSVEARRNGLAGLEFLEGIPGSVGGALRMNAGAMNAWTFDAVVSLRYMDYHGEIHSKLASEVPVTYRSCPLLTTNLALSAVFQGRPESKEEIEQRMKAYSQKRWNTQPAAPSAGCIFKNPATVPAGKLVDELGLKGTRVGGAVVSDVHGNFIVNDGTASANDVLKLIAFIKQRAQEARGLDLHTEVEIVGE